MKKVFSFSILAAMISVAVMSCDKNNGKEDEDNGVNGGKFEFADKSYSLDSATWAYYAASGRITLRLLHGEDAINIVLANVWKAEIPTGTFPFDQASTNTTFYGIGVAFSGIMGSGLGDDNLVISKSGNRYSITLAGTLKTTMGQGPYKVTYNGSIRKVN